MAHGLRCKDAFGAITVDVTTTLLRILGTINTGVTDGSYVDNRLLGAADTDFFILNGDDGSVWRNMPQVSISGAVISWSFVNNTNRVAAIVQYVRIG